jgi:hypothetical protein
MAKKKMEQAEVGKKGKAPIHVIGVTTPPEYLDVINAIKDAVLSVWGTPAPRPKRGAKFDGGSDE